ncbi:MAG: ATP-binding cassette protein [Chloroflexi bacterium]|nr:ATP-binding cassette protein [Chloroflexota bacterium]
MGDGVGDERRSVQPLLSVSGLRKYYDLSGGPISRLIFGERALHAVDGVDLAVGQDRTLGLVGESGCGKSTVAKLIARIIEPTAGSILFDGEELIGLRAARLRAVRRHLQLVFQDPFSSLNPRKRVIDIVGRPVQLHFGLRGDALQARVVELLDQVGLQSDHLYRHPHEFSGGQRQRIAIARALGPEPRLLIADEPVSALDVSVQAQILLLLRRLREERQLSMLFISHDLNAIEFVADEVAVMYAGQIVEHAPTAQLFDRPLHPYTRALLAANPDPLNPRPLQVLPGEPMAPVNPQIGCRFHARCPVRLDACLASAVPLEQKAPGHQARCIRVERSAVE